MSVIKGRIERRRREQHPHPSSYQFGESNPRIKMLNINICNLFYLLKTVTEFNLNSHIVSGEWQLHYWQINYPSIKIK